jgi:hypothetical protein
MDQPTLAEIMAEIVNTRIALMARMDRLQAAQTERNQPDASNSDRRGGPQRPGRHA